MFKKLGRMNRGRTTTKVLATLLVLTLTISNLAILGNFIGNAFTSYAISDTNSNTNIENVKFEVYVEEEGKREASRDINNEDLKLGISVKVENGGLLKDGVITLEEANFKFKDGKDKITGISIQSGQELRKELDIVSIKDPVFDLGLLSMLSKIKLTGIYVDNDGQENHVEAVKSIKVDWNSDNISEENNPIKLDQKIITNRVYEINGQEKRVIQLEVTSGIVNNQYPIKNTKIELNIPKLVNEDKPEEVKVVAYGTYATNADSGLNFYNWEYNEEDQKLNITVENTANENLVRWSKTGEDKFIVTYVYDKDIDLTNIESEINSEINLYGKNETKLTKSSTISEENLEEKGDVTTQKIDAKDVIYKSNMKLGQETEVDVNYTIQVSYANLGEKITLKNNSDAFGIAEEETLPAKTYYKYSVINKNELLKLFGEDGTLTISYLDDEAQKQNITVINKDTESDDAGNVVINYEGKYETVLFETSKPVAEGQLKIANRKQIEPAEQEQIAGINKIVLSSNLKEDSIIDNTKSAVVRIDEPTTQILLGIDNNKFSATQISNVNLTVALKADNLKYDIYTNPEITITMPEEVEEIALTEEPTLLNGNGLEIESCSVENGEIKVKLIGEQASYINADTQLLFNVNVKTRKLIPTLTRSISVKCTNNKETTYLNSELNYAENTKIVKLVAEKGVLLGNSIAGYNAQEPEVFVFKKEEKSALLGKLDEIATVKGIAINNEGKDLENVEIIGKLNGKLQVAISMENASVYYTKDEEVSRESNWNEEFNADVTGYKIVLNELKAGQIVDFSYQLAVSTIISDELKYDIYFEDAVVNSPKINLTKEAQESVENPVENPEEPANNDLLALEIIPLTDINQKLKPGDEVTLRIKVTNLQETFEEPVIEPGEYVESDVDYVEENIPVEPQGEQIESIKGHTVVIEGILSDGLVAKEAKVTVNNREEVIDLLSNSSFSIEEAVEPKAEEYVDLKLQVEEETDVSKVIGKISSKVRVPNLVGDPGEQYTGQTNENFEYNLEEDKSIKSIVLPEEIKLNLEESKAIDIKVSPEGADISGLKITIEDEEIAKLVEGNLIQAVSDGETTLTIATADGKVKETAKIVVVNPNPQREIDIPDEPANEPSENPTEEPQAPSRAVTYSITGIAWQDENQDGIMDSSEKLLSGIIARIKDKATGEYVKYENDEEIIAVTDFNGKYEFVGLKPGEYVVEFSFNAKKYKLTPKTGKDSVAYLVTTDDKSVITTEVIKVDKDINNINIGLISSQDYDLSINKYITKVIVQNAEGTNSYTFDKTKLGKVEIGSQYISGTNVIIEYGIEVKNEGKIPAYVKKIVDYVSPEFKFSSDINENWYQDSDNNLYTEELKDVEIKPGETKEVKLILTKTMTNKNLGLINNSAEIFEDYNEYAIEDKNSSPGNKDEKENDFSSADMIISIRTGGTKLYIGIVIASMMLLGGLIYLTNRRLVKSESVSEKEVK